MLAEFFGDERQAIEFLRAHAGTVLVIPGLETIEQLALGRQIQKRLDQEPHARQRLADLYGIEQRQVRNIYRRAKKIAADPQHCRCLHIPRQIRYRRRV